MSGPGVVFLRHAADSFFFPPSGSAVLAAHGDGIRTALLLAAGVRDRVAGLVLSGYEMLEEPPAAPPYDGPVLLLFGAEAAASARERARARAEAFPRGRVLFVPGAVGDPMREAPGVYAFHLAAFLNDLDPLPVESEDADREKAA